MLALIAERVSGVPFHDLVRQRVVRARPAWRDTEFLRSDELPGRAALGYLRRRRLRTNVFHLPVRGSGDGGIYSTAADSARSGRRCSAAGSCRPSGWPRWCGRAATCRRSEALRPRLLARTDRADAVILEGYDAGVSFRSVARPGVRLTHTVISNTSDGAWPITQRLDQLLNI